MKNNKASVSKKSTIIRILGLIKPHAFWIVFSVILALINVACALYVPIVIGKTIDSIISAGNVRLDIIVSSLTVVTITIIIGALAQYILSIFSNRLSYIIVADLRKSVFEHLWKLPIRYIDSHPAGDIISRVITDADQFADGMLMGFTQLFTGVATILGTLIYMMSLNAYIAIVVVLVTPLSFFVAKYISSHTYDLFKKQSVTRGEQTAIIEESLSQIKVIRAFGHENETQDIFNEANDRLEKVSLFAIFYSSLVNPSTRFVNSIVYALVALTGAFAVISGSMSVGIWSCFLNYANQYTKPFNEITGVITELQGAIACAARIFEVLDEIEESTDEGYKELEVTGGDINIKAVDFSYTDDKPLIENLNLNIKKGMKVAIVGPTGCGKTTFINLLMRFYDPQKGVINIDGNNINEVTRESLRESFGMVLQDTWLRNGTIADNIRMGKPDAPMDEVIRAAKETFAHSFIRRLDKGYDTIISEDGGSLSAGQKQLLCITRIMLTLPPMLILDEATSNIDTMTERKIQGAFLKLMEGKTSFIVAHRLSTIMNSDLIIVMKDGKVIEQGVHDELIKKDGFYAKLYKAGMGKG